MQKNFDIWIVIPLICLSVFSLFNIFGIKKDLFLNQAIFFLIGFGGFYFFNRIGTQIFRLNAFKIYLAGVFLLFLTFILGESIRGSKRWIDLYFFKFQSSEFFKPLFAIFIADYLSHHKKVLMKQWLVIFCLFLIPFFIIFKQPDLGNAVIYFLVFMGMVFVVGFPIRHFVYMGITSIVLIPLIWRFLKEYQKARIISFINPEIDSQGVAYNLIQSIITVGSGGLWGRGLGLATQSRFRFLPEYHTDFAFASLVEQFGMIGGVVILLAYAIIIYRIIKKAYQFGTHSFSHLFLFSTALFLIVSVGINVGMNLGLLPVTGIALPFISYGGSSIISTLMLLGLALSIY